MSGAKTPADLEKEAAKKQKEIQKWEKEKARPKRKWYLAYLVLIISLVYITDEVASQIGTLMKTEIANDMLASAGEKSVGMLDILNMISIPFMGIAMLYKPLADRFGRKIFLVINTFGMSLGMFIIFLSNNILLYSIGYIIIMFFIPHDTQVVYIMEAAPAKHRAKLYSVIKCIATLGIMMVPLFRKIFMAETSQWRMVYLVPAIVGLVTSFIGLLFARETDAFIDQRLCYLNLSDEELEAQKAAKKEENAQGGIIHGFRFAFRHKQLRWLFIAMGLCNIGYLLAMDYQVIMSYGYATSEFASGLFDTFDKALEYASVNQVTAAAFMFPVGSALVQLFVGFIADSKSRRASALYSSIVSTVGMLAMWYGAYHGWNAYLVGFFSGLCIGGYWAVGDLVGLMVGESSPTNLRSSIISASALGMAGGCGVTYLVGLPLVTLLGNSYAGIVCLCLALPGAVLCFLAMLFKIKDTTGLDLEAVTGCEWDG